MGYAGAGVKDHCAMRCRRAAARHANLAHHGGMHLLPSLRPAGPAAGRDHAELASARRPRAAFASRRRVLATPGLLGVVVALALAGCDASPAVTPPITPGSSAAPRDLNLIMRDYTYVPTSVDLVPGETVRLHVINGGLVMHEAVFGDMDSQLAWEKAEAATIDAPPGPTPFVPPPAGFDGVRVVGGSGQLLDVTWTVPADAASAPSGWFVGCHIPGHWAKGMVVPVRFIGTDGQPLGKPAQASGGASAAPEASATP